MTFAVANAAAQPIPTGIVPVMCVKRTNEDRHEAGTPAGGSM